VTAAAKAIFDAGAIDTEVPPQGFTAEVDGLSVLLLLLLVCWLAEFNIGNDDDDTDDDETFGVVLIVVGLLE
jgi:hypothetical protein